MQRIYIYIVIAAIVFFISYSTPIKNFFMPANKTLEMPTSEKEPRVKDDSYEKLGIELYGVATKLSDLQGKAQLLRMAKENSEWFKNDDLKHLDDLIETTDDDLKKAEAEYQKTKEEYAKQTVQKMLENFSRKE
jgi:hypothetical protein